MRTARTSDLRGAAVPPIMYGTAWKEDRTQALALEAIATGFRAFDTAGLVVVHFGGCGRVVPKQTRGDVNVGRILDRDAGCDAVAEQVRIDRAGPTPYGCGL